MGRIRAAWWRTTGLWLVGLVLMVTLVGCAREPVQPGAPLAAFAERLDARVATLMRRFDVPGVAIALVRDGEVAWTRAYGYADRDAGVPLAVDAVFHTGSLSKPVSAWGALRLVEEGALGLDDAVASIVGDWAPSPEGRGLDGVTVEDVLGHTSGAAIGPIGVSYPVGTPLPPLREVLARDVRFDRAAGSSFRYSNAGFDLIELAIEEATGERFEDVMVDLVLDPLAMTDASFAWRDAYGDRLPSGYDLRGQPVPPFLYATRASGGLFATVTDVARFVAASTSPGGDAAGRVLSRASLARLHAPRTPVTGPYGLVADAYGLGHFVEHLGDGTRAVWHGGQGYGWMTHLHVVPELGVGIVMLTNSQRSWPLIAGVLRDWADWEGVGGVKMERVEHGVAAMRALIAGLILATVTVAGRLAVDVARGRRRPAPFAARGRRRRVLRAVLGAAALSGLAWAAAQPYLLVSSVFPGVAGSAGWAGAALSFAMLADAAFAPAGEPRRSGRRDRPA